MGHNTYDNTLPTLYKWWHILYHFVILLILLMYLGVIFYHILESFSTTYENVSLSSLEAASCFIVGMYHALLDQPLIKGISVFSSYAVRGSATMNTPVYRSLNTVYRLFLTLLWHLSFNFASGGFCCVYFLYDHVYLCFLLWFTHLWCWCCWSGDKNFWEPLVS